MQARFEAFEERMNAHLEDTLDERINETFYRYKFEIMNGIDKVIGEIKTMREELAAENLRIRRHDETLLDHDKRIRAMEMRHFN